MGSIERITVNPSRDGSELTGWAFDKEGSSIAATVQVNGDLQQTASDLVRELLKGRVSVSHIKVTGQTDYADHIKVAARDHYNRRNYLV